MLPEAEITARVRASWRCYPHNRTRHVVLDRLDAGRELRRRRRASGARASRAQKRAGARVSAAGTAAGNAFWDRMVAKATGKDAVTTETALFALG